MPVMTIRRLATSAALAYGLWGCTTAPQHTAAFVPGLGEIMAQIAMRHNKLWFAGQGGNWPLTAYEMDELREGLDDATHYHPIHKHVAAPLAELFAATMQQPLQQLDQAIAARDPIRFATAYDGLTAGCNACHQASDFAFNVVIRPTANPFTNQSFGVSK